MWRRLRWILLLVILGILGKTIELLGTQHAAMRELEEVIAELDAADPDWRLEAIEAKRKKIPDEENAALAIMKITKALPEQRAFNKVMDRIQKHAPNRRLQAKYAAELELSLKSLAVESREARALRRYWEGRYPIAYADNFLLTNLNNEQDSRRVALFLERVAVHSAEEGEWQEATDACHAYLVCASAMGDEPITPSQFVRMAMRHVASEVLERILAQYQLDDAMLTEFQNRWQKESEFPTTRVWLRGDRAGLSHVCEGLQRGQIHPEELSGTRNGSSTPGPLRELTHFIARANYIESESAILRKLTEALSKLDLPSPEFFEYAKSFDAAKRDSNMPTIAKLLLPAYEKVWQADYRSLAMMRCATAALAVERFRLKNERWPKELDEVMPEFLKALPLDPYNAQPICFRAAVDGVVVFSPGPDGAFRGDFWDLPRRQRNGSGRSYEFRLWNPESRRLPALAHDGTD
ncbi:MAG: hypothetical protein HY040_13790 [Planctomycetes bacterium]|nr:hypothetical protein [Planctomycetota bacterium]